MIVPSTKRKTYLSHGQISLIISSDARIFSSMLTTLHIFCADYSLILVFHASFKTLLKRISYLRGFVNKQIKRREAYVNNTPLSPNT